MTPNSTGAFILAALDEDEAFCSAGHISRQPPEAALEYSAVSFSDDRPDQTRPRLPVELHARSENGLVLEQPNEAAEERSKEI